MFEAVFDGFMAFNSLFFLLGALVFLALGGGILADFIHKRMTYYRTTGVIKGVVTRERSATAKHSNSTIYYSVIEYTGPDGQTVQATPDSGSSSLTSRIPGTVVPLLINPNDPQTIRRPTLLWFFIGLIFMGCSVPFFYAFASHFNFTLGGMIGTGVAVTFILYKAVRGFNKIKRDKPLTVEAFKAMTKARRKESFSDMIDPNEIRTRIQEADRRNKKTLPFFYLLSVLLIGGGTLWAFNTIEFMKTAHSASGEVVNLKREHSGDSHTYYPVVKFKTPANKSVRFQDRVGSNPASYKIGESVNVLYDPNEAKDAMIDRGIWNWGFHALVWGIGFLFLLAAVNISAGLRKRRTL